MKVIDLAPPPRLDQIPQPNVLAGLFSRGNLPIRKNLNDIFDPFEPADRAIRVEDIHAGPMIDIAGRAKAIRHQRMYAVAVQIAKYV